ncbi:unnamed protein product, partial [Rotaria magnacalcarata]
LLILRRVHRLYDQLTILLNHYI